MCERSGRPLTVAEQRRRYRRRKRLPDWVWGVLVGLALSGVLVMAMLLRF
jgi:type VI protein secretion system component VasF